MNVHQDWTGIINFPVDGDSGGGGGGGFDFRTCCFEKTFTYETEPEIDYAHGNVFYTQNHTFESVIEWWGRKNKAQPRQFFIGNPGGSNSGGEEWPDDCPPPASYPNFDCCPTWFVAGSQKYESTRIDQYRASLIIQRKEIRVRISKAKLSCEESEDCFFVVSVINRVRLTPAYSRLFYTREKRTHTTENECSEWLNNVLEQDFDNVSGNQTTYGDPVATATAFDFDFVFTKRFETLPESFSFEDIDEEWECLVSACHELEPVSEVCIEIDVTGLPTSSPYATSIEIVSRTDSVVDDFNCRPSSPLSVPIREGFCDSPGDLIENRSYTLSPYLCPMPDLKLLVKTPTTAEGPTNVPGTPYPRSLWGDDCTEVAPPCDDPCGWEYLFSTIPNPSDSLPWGAAGWPSVRSAAMDSTWEYVQGEVCYQAPTVTVVTCGEELEEDPEEIDPP
jgi:hypothetical protein